MSDLTTETERVVPAGAGGAKGTARSSLFCSRHYGARSPEDVIDARLHQFHSYG